MEDVIPERLRKVEWRDDFLAWLRGTGLDQEDRKQLLMFWADRVGVKIAGEMIRRAGIE